MRANYDINNLNPKSNPYSQLLNQLNGTKTFSDSEQLNKELKEIVSNYESWLNLSYMTEEQFLSFADRGGFDIQQKTQDIYTVISLLAKSEDGGAAPIGETIAYPTADTEAAMNCTMLLMYLASRLDEQNKQPQNYFWNIAKEFCKKNIKG